MAKKKKKRILPRVLVVFIILAVIIFGCQVIHEYRFPLKYEEYIYEYSSEDQVDPYLVMAMIRTESNFIHDAQSNQKAKGLMQIMDSTAYWIAEKMDMEDFKIIDLKDPETNIKMGTWYIAWLIKHYNNEQAALAAYNGGLGNVNKWLSDKRYSSNGKSLDKIPYKETREYVDKVIKYQATYEKLYKGK